MAKDYFVSARKGFRAAAWLWVLFFIIGLIGFVGNSYGRVPSSAQNMAVAVWLLESGAGLILCFICARLFKNKSSKAITMGYVSLLVVAILSVLLFMTTGFVLGILPAAIIICLFYTVIKAQKQGINTVTQ